MLINSMGYYETPVLVDGKRGYNTYCNLEYTKDEGYSRDVRIVVSNDTKEEVMALVDFLEDLNNDVDFTSDVIHVESSQLLEYKDEQ